MRGRRCEALRRIALVLTVALIMVAMLAVSALPAMASGNTDRRNEVACGHAPTVNGQERGPANAHESVPNDDVSGAPQETAHENIPCD
jgi:hypothetical protein